MLCAQLELRRCTKKDAFQPCAKLTAARCQGCLVTSIYDHWTLATSTVTKRNLAPNSKFNWLNWLWCGTVMMRYTVLFTWMNRCTLFDCLLQLQLVRGHSFQPQHYYTTTVCNHCTTNLWGVGYQGYQCDSTYRLPNKSVQNLVKRLTILTGIS